MRQAGILAAAGLIAIEEMPKRLHEDHANALFLAEGLAKIPKLAVYPEKVKTNIVAIGVSRMGISSAEFLRRLRLRHLIGSTVNDSTIRLLTHKDVGREECERAIEIVAEVCK